MERWFKRSTRWFWTHGWTTSSWLTQVIITNIFYWWCRWRGFWYYFDCLTKDIRLGWITKLQRTNWWDKAKWWPYQCNCSHLQTRSKIFKWEASRKIRVMGRITQLQRTNWWDKTKWWPYQCNCCNLQTRSKKFLSLHKFVQLKNI